MEGSWRALEIRHWSGYETLRRESTALDERRASLRNRHLRISTFHGCHVGETDRAPSPCVHEIMACSRGRIPRADRWRLGAPTPLWGLPDAALAGRLAVGLPGNHQRWMDERTVTHDGHELWVGDQPGPGPGIVLLHGFPDNHHLYDRVLPYLRGRHVVAFDFLGWGDSDKPRNYDYTADAQTRELESVIRALGLDRVILVAHDASGPPAIDWALAHPDQVERLVLLNTYYCRMDSLRPPEAIWLFSTPVVRPVARWVARRFHDQVFRRMYFWQVGRFFRDPAVRDEFLPLLYEQFERRPSAHRAFFALNEDLRPTLRERAHRRKDLLRFERPVRILFGNADPYLNSDVARDISHLFPRAELRFVEGARHFVQMDEPRRVAQEITRDA